MIVVVLIAMTMAAAVLTAFCVSTESLAASSSHGYMVTVYNYRGTYYKRWTDVDKVSIVDGGAIQFFDNHGNTVILSPGCDVVVEWIGDPDE